MGRLGSARARLWITAAFLVLYSGASLLTRALVTVDGISGMSLALGVVVAYLLSIGPRGGVAVAAVVVLDATLFRGASVSASVVVMAVVQALAAVAAVTLLERRFAHHGPVRKPIVMLEFGLIAGLLLPVVTRLSWLWIGPFVGTEVSAGDVVDHVIGDGIGVLAVAAGLRMLVMGQRVRLDASVRRAVVLSSTSGAALALGTLVVGGVDALVESQVVIVPLLAAALFAGTVAYSVAVLAMALAVTIPVALFGSVSGFAITTTTHATWWIVVFAGLLLATEGDRRRATLAEFETMFTRSATATTEVNLATGRVVRANGALAALTGRSADAIVGAPLSELLVERADVLEHFAAISDGRADECSAEFELPRPDGTIRWVRCAAVRVVLGGPQPDVLQVQFVDLTTERDREEALQRSNQSLERFGRRVTHDLKQPLAAIAGYASTLREHGDRLDPELTATMHERLDAVARRAVTQLDETFVASQVPTGGPSPVRLQDVVASVVGVLDIGLAETGGQVSTALAAPAVTTDPSLLRQVLHNLLTNSLKYASADRVPRMRVASRVRGAGVEVTVTDNGPGIPSDALDAVFERGRRLEPDRAEGTGDGLADSRELAESAGGWLRAEPWADGARFVLWLPDASVVGEQRTTRVLIVEDDLGARSLLQTRLSLTGSVDVVGAVGSIAEAVAATRERRPDVVLLDRWLTDGDGLDGVGELARAHPDVRVIMLTSDITPGLDQVARSGGVLRTLDKATDDDVLVAQLVGAAD